MSNYQNYRNEWMEAPDDRMEERINRRLKQRQIRKRKALIEYFIFCSSIVIIVLVAVVVGLDLFSDSEASANSSITGNKASVYLEQPTWQEDFLTPNEYSRPQTLIEKVNGVVVHYVGNPNTTAKQNRDYFENLATTHETSASSHFVVGLEGEIIQCMPLNEVAYASNQRNKDTISIEVCHPKDDGKFNEKTYNSLIKLTAWLCEVTELTPNDVIRHYDITEKACPLYYVENPDEWELLKADVGFAMN